MIPATKKRTDTLFERQSIELGFTYPIAVFQGPLYGVHQGASPPKPKPTEYLQLRHSVSIDNQVTLRRIDVVAESYLPTLLQMIGEETDRIDVAVRKNLDRLLRSAIDQKAAEQQTRGRAMSGAHLRGDRR